MPLLRIKLTVVINTDEVDIGAGMTYVDTTPAMTEHDWVDAMQQYIVDYPEEVLEMFSETADQIEQVTENATVEFVEWNANELPTP